MTASHHEVIVSYRGRFLYIFAAFHDKVDQYSMHYLVKFKEILVNLPMDLFSPVTLTSAFSLSCSSNFMLFHFHHFIYTVQQVPQVRKIFSYFKFSDKVKCTDTTFPPLIE